MFKVGLLLAVLVILHPRKTVTQSDCTDDYPITDPDFVGCYQEQGSWSPFLSDEINGVQVETANDCISCCVAAANASYNFAGIVPVEHPTAFHCTCGNMEKNFYSAFYSYTDCTKCPGNDSQSCGFVPSRVSVYKVPQYTPEDHTEYSTQPYGASSSAMTTHTLQKPDSTATTAQPPSRSPVVTLHRSTRTSVSPMHAVPSSGSSAKTSDPTQPPIPVSTTLSKGDINGTPDLGDRTALIAGSAGGGAGFLLVVCGVVAFCIIRKRSTLRKENNPTASIMLDGVGTSTDSALGGRNPSFQSNSVNVDALYAKPDKKKKNQQQPPSTPTPEDPSYQDVLPSGAQHQYAAVQDDTHPYTVVRDEPNLYDSIQDDPQYATVQKSRKQAPNVEPNPLYGRGSVDNTAYDSVGPLSNDNDRAPSVCEMTDNIIYG